MNWLVALIPALCVIAAYTLGVHTGRKTPNRINARRTINDTIGAYIAMGFSKAQAQELCRVQHAEVLKKAGVWDAAK